MKKIVLVYFLCCVFTYAVFGQVPGIQNIVPPNSPQAVGLTRPVETPVSLSNGLVDINIPLFEFQSSKAVLPISLIYNGGGHKVTDRASSVGLGFSLSAGGAITRSIVGNADETSYGLNYPDSLSENYSGQYFQYFSNNTDFKNIFCYVNGAYNAIENVGGSVVDAGPDNYYYNVPGLSGRFTYGNNKNIVTNPHKPISIKYDPYKIPYTLKNSDGVTYGFGALNPGAALGVLNMACDYLEGENHRKNISAWYLTSITSADKSDTLTIHYSNTHDQFSISESTANIYQEHGQRKSRAEAKEIRSDVQSMEYNTRVEEIKGRNGRIKFNYYYENASYEYRASNLSTQIITQPVPILGSIVIYSRDSEGEKILKSFEFRYSHFQSATTNAPNSLRLDAIEEVTSEERKILYSFQYSTNDIFKYRTKGCDIWGYYNGRDGNRDLLLFDKNFGIDANGNQNLPDFKPEKREGNPTLISKGLLTAIQHPTKGTTTFAFEPNVIELNNNTATPTTYLTGRISTPDQAGAQGSNTVFNPMANANVARKVVFSGTNNCSGGTNCIVNTPRIVLKNLNTNTIVLDKTLSVTMGLNGVEQLETFEQLLPPLNPDHQYQFYLPNPGIMQPGKQLKYTLAGTLSETFQENTPTMRTVYGGGLRIGAITQADGNGGTIRKRYNYTRPYLNSNLFNGTLERIGQAMLKNGYMIDLNTDPLIGAAFGIVDGVVPPYQVSTTYMESLPFSIGGPGSSISYKEVEELQETLDGKTNGKTIFNFNEGIDYVQNWMLTNKLDRSAIRNQLVRTRIFKDTDQGLELTKDTRNEYNNINDRALDDKGSKFIRRYVASYELDDGLEPFSQENRHPSCPIYLYRAPIRFNTIFENIVSSVLVTTRETEYHNGDSLVTSSQFIYNNLEHLQPSQIIRESSNGMSTIQNISYSSEVDFPYNVGNSYLINPRPTFFGNLSPSFNSIINLRLENHIVPIETSTFVRSQSGGAAKLIKSDFYHYHPVLPVVDSVSSLELEKAVYDLGSPYTFPRRLFSYGNGKIEIDARYKKILGNKFNTRGNLVEQQVRGGAPTTYLWGYYGQYPLAEIKNASYNEIVLILGQQTINNLYAKPFTDESINTIVNKLRGNVLLSKSIVVGYNYSPYVGITSIIDMRGITTYYKYDGGQRLRAILDHLNNVTKSFDYHYRPN